SSSKYSLANSLVNNSSTAALLHPTNISLNEEIEECSENLLQGNTGIVFQLLNAAIGSRWERKRSWLSVHHFIYSKANVSDQSLTFY
ncbi:hypothetical protein TNIN_409421, partial [Trichonephila inaurata madagascariensis]